VSFQQLLAGRQYALRCTRIASGANIGLRCAHERVAAFSSQRAPVLN